MKSKILLGLLLCVLLAACSKDKYTTKPQLTFKSVNLRTVAAGQILTFKLEYTDKEGDVGGHTVVPGEPDFLDSLVVVEKIAKNCPDSYNLSFFSMPEVPVIKDTKGELEVSYAYRINTPNYAILPEPACQGRNDSCVFRFVLKDHEKNVSDTVTSPEIVILNQ